MLEIKCHLGGLVVGGVEAFDGDLSEDVGLQRLLGQVAVVDDGWMEKQEKHHLICSRQYVRNMEPRNQTTRSLL